MIEEAARYFWFSERFQWTPDEVDNLPSWLKERYPAVAVIYDEVQKSKAAND